MKLPALQTNVTESLNGKVDRKRLFREHDWSVRKGSGKNNQGVTLPPNYNPNGNKVPRTPKLPLIDDLSLLRETTVHSLCLPFPV